jgi:hypothetical protein
VIFQFKICKVVILEFFAVLCWPSYKAQRRTPFAALLIRNGHEIISRFIFPPVEPVVTKQKDKTGSYFMTIPNVLIEIHSVINIQ